MEVPSFNVIRSGMSLSFAMVDPPDAYLGAAARKANNWHMLYRRIARRAY